MGPTDLSVPATFPWYLCLCFGDADSTCLWSFFQRCRKSKVNRDEYGIGTHSLLLILPLEEAVSLRSQAWKRHPVMEKAKEGKECPGKGTGEGNSANGFISITHLVFLISFFSSIHRPSPPVFARDLCSVLVQ